MLKILDSCLGIDVHTHFANAMKVCLLMKDFWIKKAFKNFYFCPTLG